MERIDLKGMLPEGIPAKAHQADKVTYFCSSDGRMMICPAPNHYGRKHLVLRTKRQEYLLPKHSVHNYYFGTCNGIKVQVSVKRIVAEIRYWPNNPIL